ncbi:Coenzyme F420 hydrogenase/dehydrogenase, beta subunit C-terminal domain [bacterium]|nr:Coenzyme F420 hydrogenase/dehydrogenase, beta subunit C-terminal domain [bacterium]
MKNNYSKKKLIGDYLNCYTGYSLDPKIRYYSSSGGLVTSVLKFMLEEGLVDGVLVVRMKKKDPFKAESFIARSSEEIVSAQGSKYCPVDMSNGLKEIISSKPGSKFAIVGLPCQIKAFRRNQEIQQKIVLYLGLFCNHTPSAYATQVFLKNNKIKPGEVLKISYRGEGWPGCVEIIKKNGKKILIPTTNSWPIIGSDFFTPKRCFLCDDHVSEFADISFGDAWLTKFKDDKKGRSIIIARTHMGEKIIKDAENKLIIKLSPVSGEKTILSQLVPIYLKKKNLQARSFLFGERKKNDSRVDLLDFVLAFPAWLIFNIFKIDFFKKNIKKLPFSFFDTYNKIMNKGYTLKARRDFKKIIY